MNIPFPIKKQLENMCGRKLDSASDCEFFALAIESKTKEHIGRNTIKRMFGIINEERTPRQSTLNIIARYLDYEDWNTLYKNSVLGVSSFSPIEGTINSSDLQPGNVISISYKPDRNLVVEYNGDNKYEVVSCKNSKLMVGDIITVHYIIPKYPLIVQDVTREGTSLGAYSAAKQTGLDSVELYTA